MNAREIIAHIEFCQQNCNLRSSDCHAGKSKKRQCQAIFVEERERAGWPFVMADQILSALSAELPPVLHHAETCILLVDAKGTTRNEYIARFKCNYGGQAQRDADLVYCATVEQRVLREMGEWLQTMIQPDCSPNMDEALSKLKCGEKPWQEQKQ